MNLHLKDFIKCSQEISNITLHGIILFGWIFEDSSEDSFEDSSEVMNT